MPISTPDAGRPGEGGVVLEGHCSIISGALGPGGSEGSTRLLGLWGPQEVSGALWSLALQRAKVLSWAAVCVCGGGE